MKCAQHDAASSTTETLKCCRQNQKGGGAAYRLGYVRECLAASIRSTKLTAGRHHARSRRKRTRRSHTHKRNSSWNVEPADFTITAMTRKFRTAPNRHTLAHRPQEAAKKDLQTGDVCVEGVNARREIFGTRPNFGAGSLVHARISVRDLWYIAVLPVDHNSGQMVTSL